ncbi:hypothetical protein LWI29_036494 [Acer saccharum]|uniref:Non-haem dioxygenase N-terminal domain-containing protein n=1 Tax=Acer saccharum TaxID=4024 RepID=A0AA39T130_ACESA|nr:hypothetical protein LWI29_036494 [Acer saccharum]
MDINTHEPPFQETYGVLFQNSTTLQKAKDHNQNHSMVDNNKECKLPLIHLDRLNFRYLDNDHLNNFQELDNCIEEMAEAASEWGFFQVVNHGTPRKVLDSMRYEEMKMFNQPFHKKSEENFMNLSAESYHWGNPIATCLRQLSWSKAFHIPLTDISRLDNVCNNSGSAIGLFLEKAAGLAQRLAEVLAQKLGVKSSYFQENCVPSSSSKVILFSRELCTYQAQAQAPKIIFRGLWADAALTVISSPFYIKTCRLERCS